MKSCPECQGVGILRHQWLHGGRTIYGPQTVVEKETCPFCNGTGKVVQCECGIWNASDKSKCTCGRNLSVIGNTKGEIDVGTD